MAVRRTNTTGRRSTGRESRVVQRGDIQRIELGIIQNIRQRNLFGNRLSGSLSGRCRRCLADGRTVTQSLASHRLIRVNCRLLCGSCYRLYRCLSLSRLNGLSRLRRYRLGSRCRSLLSGLNSLRPRNRSLRYLLLCRSVRRSRGSGGAALLIEEHATAANRLETARTLLATFLTVSRRRLGRTSSSRTSGRRANRTSSLRRHGHLLTSNNLGGILRCLHRNMCAVRICRLAAHVAYGLAGSGLTSNRLTSSRARLGLRLFSSLRFHALSNRALRRFGRTVEGFVIAGLFVRFTLSVIALSFFCFSLSAALIAVRLDLGGKRLQ